MSCIVSSFCDKETTSARHLDFPTGLLMSAEYSRRLAMAEK